MRARVVSLVFETWHAVAAGILAVLLPMAFLASRRRRRHELEQLLRKMAWDRIEDVIIPDEVDGEIQLDLVLLVTGGILVLEVRRVAGTLFWGDQLENWTLLDGPRRTVLRNPLPALSARIHAVEALAPTAPVEGRVLLAGPVTISGGAPPGVLLPDELFAEVPSKGKQRPPPELQAAWKALKQAARPA